MASLRGNSGAEIGWERGGSHANIRGRRVLNRRQRQHTALRRERAGWVCLRNRKKASVAAGWCERRRGAQDEEAGEASRTDNFRVLQALKGSLDFILRAVGSAGMHSCCNGVI